MIYPVILAGGSGSRLWPLSRQAYPKQFLSLGSDASLLQQTLARVQGCVSGQDSVNRSAVGKGLVVCNEEHRFLVAEQLRGDNEFDIVIEPEGKNTAPALALAAFQLMKQNPGQVPVMLVTPADHQVSDDHAFVQAVEQLLPAVESGNFGTLGVVPTGPHTGYGYIQMANELTGDELSESVCRVHCFVEKPDLALAQRYIEQGSEQWLWNSGLFLIRADRYLDELQRLQPDIFSACQQAVERAVSDLDFIRVDADSFSQCPADSIDYALMEPLAADGQVVVAALDAGWSDIGSWNSLADVYPQDSAGNTVISNQSAIGNQSAGCTLLHDTQTSTIYSDQRLVAALGVKDLIIVDTADALLIADKNRDQDIKHLVSALEQQQRPEVKQHRISHRPWGCYDVVTLGDGYKVKKICVNEGASLSLQRHQHRAEHWVVVSGLARVTCGDDVYLVHQNESTYISPKQMHKLENPGDEPLVIIEVQTGDYLEEDDIERLDDRYGRE